MHSAGLVNWRELFCGTSTWVPLEHCSALLSITLVTCWVFCCSDSTWVSREHFSALHSTGVVTLSEIFSGSFTWVEIEISFSTLYVVGVVTLCKYFCRFSAWVAPPSTLHSTGFVTLRNCTVTLAQSVGESIVTLEHSIGGSFEVWSCNKFYQSSTHFFQSIVILYKNKKIRMVEATYLSFCNGVRTKYFRRSTSNYRIDRWHSVRM